MYVCVCVCMCVYVLFCMCPLSTYVPLYATAPVWKSQLQCPVLYFFCVSWCFIILTKFRRCALHFPTASAPRSTLGPFQPTAAARPRRRSSAQGRNSGGEFLTLLGHEVVSLGTWLVMMMMIIIIMMILMMMMMMMMTTTTQHGRLMGKWGSNPSEVRVSYFADKPIWRSLWPMKEEWLHQPSQPVPTPQVSHFSKYPEN